jgi:hypothetical protein
MRYRVAFTKRVASDGADSGMQPSAELDENLSDGVVAEKVFVEAFETDAQHSQEVLDEDDAFLGSAAAEIWDYEVVDLRAREFEQALQNSDLVLEYDIVDTLETSGDDAAFTAPSARGVYPMDGGNDAADVTSGGSGVRAGDDGPAGMPTGDPSAGGLGARPRTEVLGLGDNGGIDDLNVTTADDPRLGLTNRGRKPAEDWAADTGPTRNPHWKDEGVNRSR